MITYYVRDWGYFGIVCGWIWQLKMIMVCKKYILLLTKVFCHIWHGEIKDCQVDFLNTK